MTIPVFPTLPGQGWPVHKRPTFSTRVQSHVSGREVRNALYSYPLYEWELTFDGLDSLGIYPGLNTPANALSLQSIMGLYIACQGQFGTFLYVDPADNVTPTAPGEPMAPVTAMQFTFQRSIGASGTSSYFLEPASYVLGSGDGAYSNPAIYVGGSLVSTGYTWGASGANTITFASPPASAPTAVFSYGFICRFSDDQNDFENFMNGLWKVESLKFKSVRSQ